VTEAIYQTDTITLYHGDSLIVLSELDDCSVDSIVTDPPYELGFMGKSWDASGIAYNVDLWAECLRVLKPGGHLLAFGGTRTYHRMTVAIEDAGFEIRDSLHWVYGSGFPKSHNVSKAIDKAAGAEREVIAHQDVGPDIRGGNYENAEGRMIAEITVPTTDAAKQWEGWGTALKPAHEPIVLARKPLVGTVAANVLEHGTGALNIDGCRVPGEPWATVAPNAGGRSGGVMGKAALHPGGEAHVLGRWPANIIFDEEAGAELDAQSGIEKSGIAVTRNGGGRKIFNAKNDGARVPDSGYSDTGGASRFFYCPKASRAERDAGLDDISVASKRVTDYAYQGRECTTCGSRSNRNGRWPDCDHDNWEWVPKKAEAHKGGNPRNIHPTVKPIALMRWLVRLITPPEGIVLDPFTGSGTTLAAATLEGVNAVGIELTDDYLPIIIGRCEHAAGVRAETVDDDTQLSFDW